MNPLADDLDHVLANTVGLWEELRGQRILITGGTGFFGCWLLETFIWANDKLRLGASVVVLTRSPKAFQKKAPHLTLHPAVQLHAGDVRSFNFPSGKFSCVIHAASVVSPKVNDEQPLQAFDTIVEGTRRALEFARESGARKFLLVSSGAVYGRQPAEISHLSESYPGAPDTSLPGSAYGAGKRAAELLCTLYAHQFGLEPKIARCFAFLGPYLPLDGQFAIGSFIRDAINGDEIMVNGDGTPYRSYLYAADLAIWLWHLLLRAPACRPYNVGSPEAISIIELARAVARCVNPNAKTLIQQLPEPGVPPTRYVPAVERAQAELSLTATVSLDEAIRRTADWARRTLAAQRNGL